MALPLLPSQDIVDGFNCIFNHFNGLVDLIEIGEPDYGHKQELQMHQEKIRDFFMYYRRFWINGTIANKLLLLY